MSNLRKHYNVADSNGKRCDPIPLCCDFSWVIGFNETMRLRIFSSFETYLITWPPCSVRRFLHITTKSSWTSLQIFKGGVFSFLRLCSNFYTSCKANVVEGRMLFGFNNAFAFALYSKCFHPLQDTHPPLHFLMVGTTSVWEDSLWNPQLCHNPSFGVH